MHQHFWLTKDVLQWNKCLSEAISMWIPSVSLVKYTDALWYEEVSLMTTTHQLGKNHAKEVWFHITKLSCGANLKIEQRLIFWPKLVSHLSTSSWQIINKTQIETLITMNLNRDLSWDHHSHISTSQKISPVNLHVRLHLLNLKK